MNIVLYNPPSSDPPLKAFSNPSCKSQWKRSESELGIAETCFIRFHYSVKTTVSHQLARELIGRLGQWIKRLTAWHTRLEVYRKAGIAEFSAKDDTRNFGYPSEFQSFYFPKNFTNSQVRIILLRETCYYEGDRFQIFLITATL